MWQRLIKAVRSSHAVLSWYCKTIPQSDTISLSIVHRTAFFLYTVSFCKYLAQRNAWNQSTSNYSYHTSTFKAIRISYSDHMINHLTTISEYPKFTQSVRQAKINVRKACRLAKDKIRMGKNKKSFIACEMSEMRQKPNRLLSQTLNQVKRWSMAYVCLWAIQCRTITQMLETNDPNIYWLSGVMLRLGNWRWLPSWREAPVLRSHYNQTTLQEPLWLPMKRVNRIILRLTLLSVHARTSGKREQEKANRLRNLSC